MAEIAKNDLLSRVLREQDPVEFASHLSDPALLDAFKLPDGIDYSSLTMKGKWTIIGKVRWIKRWFREAKALFPADTTLHFPLRSKHGCHMDDKGNVCFPFRVFLKRFDPLVKYVFHESAHLYLAGQDDYAALLELDRAFLARLGGKKEAICLSPVEYFASRLSLLLLEEAAAAVAGTRLAKRLLMQKGVEER